MDFSLLSFCFLVTDYGYSYYFLFSIGFSLFVLSGFDHIQNIPKPISNVTLSYPSTTDIQQLKKSLMPISSSVEDLKRKQMSFLENNITLGVVIRMILATQSEPIRNYVKKLQFERWALFCKKFDSLIQSTTTSVIKPMNALQVALTNCETPTIPSGGINIHKASVVRIEGEMVTSVRQCNETFKRVGEDLKLIMSEIKSLSELSKRKVDVLKMEIEKLVLSTPSSFQTPSPTSPTLSICSIPPTNPILSSTPSSTPTPSSSSTPTPSSTPSSTFTLCLVSSTPVNPLVRTDTLIECCELLAEYLKLVNTIKTEIAECCTCITMNINEDIEKICLQLSDGCLISDSVLNMYI